MQRTGRNAKRPSRPSNERSSAGLNLTDSQRGHTRRIHNTRGSQFGQVIVSALMEKLLSRFIKAILHLSRVGPLRKPRYRSKLLDFARTHRDIHDAKTQIPGDVNGVKLGG